MDHHTHTTQRLQLDGRVQGVGFRPFVYRLAHRLGLRGRVRNLGGRVEILVQGEAGALERFRRELLDQPPPLARPRLLTVETLSESEPFAAFTIDSSRAGEALEVHVPPDQFACGDCLREMHDPQARRYRYPFTNCTQCGPRYTLIRTLPYDRPNTAMAGFPLCPACRAEYEDPLDRRFHAQPLACPVCGPRLWYHDADSSVAPTEAALAAAVSALLAGRIVAVRGVGGYHLLCDAGDEAAVARLRQRKRRPDKPLAVMFPQPADDPLARLRRDLAPDAAHAALLTAPERPIVLTPMHTGCRLAPGIAPGLREVGAMLPYSPLHHLLLEAFNGPLVATSGNISGEPVLTGVEEAEQRLAPIADAFLHHDRPILRPADDSVWRVIAGRGRPLRVGRGHAPLELPLPRPVAVPTLAVGAHMKNTVALAWNDRLVLSPHIGDLESRRGMAVFETVIGDLQQLYGVRAERVVHDAHPAYASRRWAESCGLPTRAVFHHHAHASALYGDHAGEGEWLVFTWDGVGYGEDGGLWGGEALLGRPGQWRRVARLRPFPLPGGERAGREPWRAAFGACWLAEHPGYRPPAETGLLEQALARGLNTPYTSAAGRLFDAAAALLGLVETASFEGQGPMWLEALASPADARPLPLKERDGLLEIDWSPLLPRLSDNALTVAERSGHFQGTLASTITAVATRLRRRHSFDCVGLGGGVFQNRRLTEQASATLQAAGFVPRLARSVPCNDAGVAYGQIIESAWESS